MIINSKATEHYFLHSVPHLFLSWQWCDRYRSCMSPYGTSGARHTGQHRQASSVLGLPRREAPCPEGLWPTPREEVQVLGVVAVCSGLRGRKGSGLNILQDKGQQSRSGTQTLTKTGFLCRFSFLFKNSTSPAQVLFSLLLLRFFHLTVSSPWWRFKCQGVHSHRSPLVMEEREGGILQDVLCEPNEQGTETATVKICKASFIRGNIKSEKKASLMFTQKLCD